MEKKVWLFHETKPGGQLFIAETTNLAAMSEQGWADSPSKIGGNPWGVDQGYVDEIKDKVDQGVLPRMNEEEKENDKTAGERANALLAQKEQENRMLRQELSASQKSTQDAERLLDERSDAFKENNTKKTREVLNIKNSHRGAGAKQVAKPSS